MFFSVLFSIHPLQGHSARFAYHSATECRTLSGSELFGARPGQNHIDDPAARCYSDLLDITVRHQGDSAHVTVSHGGGRGRGSAHFDDVGTFILHIIPPKLNAN